MEWFYKSGVLVLAGAAIGYVTNFVAIRMLFRPHRAWRVFRLRVPMTPGVIPARRHALAADIGAMVGTHLLPPEEFSRTLRRAESQEGIRRAVEDNLERALEFEIGTLDDLIPAPFRAEWTRLVERLEALIYETTLSFLQSDPFWGHMDRVIEQRVDHVLEKDLDTLLGDEGGAELRSYVEERLRRVQQGDALESTIAVFLDARLEAFLSSHRPLGSYLPEDFSDSLHGALADIVPGLMERLAVLIYDPSFQESVAVQMKKVASGMIANLGFAGRVLLMGLDANSLDKKIRGALAEGQEQIAAALKSPETRLKVVEFLRQQVDRTLEKSPGDALSRWPHSRITAAKAYVEQRAVASLRRPELSERVLEGFDRQFELLKAAKLARLAEQFLPDQAVDRAKGYVKAKARELVASDDLRRALKSSLHDAVGELLSRRPVGRLSRLLPSHVITALREFLFARVMTILEREVPRLSSALDVSAIVERKINGFEVEMVENLVAGVMREQFKYINLFGALLGGIIGLLNALLLFR